MFEVQVNTREGWRSVRPTGGQPYRFSTRREAEDTMRMIADPFPMAHTHRVVKTNRDLDGE